MLYRIVFRPSGSPVSIQFSQWPEYDDSRVDNEAEEAGKLLVDILTGVRRWKTANKVHANFPLKEMVITSSEEEKARLQLIIDDLQAAAHSESLKFSDRGDIPTEAGS